MAEHEYNDGELPLMTAGRKLREARETAGLSIEDISERTKIAARHLEAIEQDRFSDLASRTYAIGFARTYARSLGLNDAAIVDSVRRQLASEGEARVASKPDNFEPGDPARVPSRSLAWVAGVGALVLFVLLFIFWRSFINPAGTLPDLATQEKPVASAQPAPAASESAAIAANAPVVLTAEANVVWVKVTDGAGNQLFQKEMAMGESYTVPSDASGPLLTTARPDALRITVGGKVLPFLSNVPSVMRDIPVDAPSLAGKAEQSAPAATAPAAAASPGLAPAAAPQAAPSPRPTATPQPAPSPRPTPSPSPVASRPAAPSPSPAAAKALSNVPAAPAVSVNPSAAGETSTVSE